MLKKIKGLIIRSPKFLSISNLTHLGLSSRKYPPDMVETFIQEKKKELMKKKGKKDA